MGGGGGGEEYSAAGDTCMSTSCTGWEMVVSRPHRFLQYNAVGAFFGFKYSNALTTFGIKIYPVFKK